MIYVSQTKGSLQAFTNLSRKICDLSKFAVELMNRKLVLILVLFILIVTPIMCSKISDHSRLHQKPIRIIREETQTCP